jgi:hypothetical protein
LSKDKPIDCFDVPNGRLRISINLKDESIGTKQLVLNLVIL